MCEQFLVTSPQSLNGNRRFPHLHDLVDAVVDEYVLTLSVCVCEYIYIIISHTKKQAHAIKISGATTH